jgi:hypothetical protein
MASRPNNRCASKGPFHPGPAFRYEVEVFNPGGTLILSGTLAVK